MLMFDPVPVKQEAMDPVSVVSFPESNIFLFIPSGNNMSCVVLFLKVTHYLTGIGLANLSKSPVVGEGNTLPATVHPWINGVQFPQGLRPTPLKVQ